MKTTITIISENSVEMPKNVIGEHGLAILIERDTATLCDTGQGFTLMHNLGALFKKASQISRVSISHGHYDHTGGLEYLLESEKRSIPVFAHPDIFTQRIAVAQIGVNQIELPIGTQKTQSEYEGMGAVFNFITGYKQIADGITAFSEIPRPAGWKGTDDRLKKKINGVLADDDFTDDTSLLVDTKSGPVIVCGCAHAGIVEILDHISNVTGHKQFSAVIGGTHLGAASPEYIQRAIDVFKKYNLKLIAASHCTGFYAAADLYNAFGRRYRQASVGTVFEF